MLGRNVMRWNWVALLMASMALLAGCGSSAGGSGGSSSAAGSTVASLAIVKSTPNLTSDGTGTVTLTVTAKDINNLVQTLQPVAISTTDKGAVITQLTATTDTSGNVTATVTTTDPTVRQIPITATSGAVTATTTIGVVGTTMSLNGPSSVVAGGTAALTGTLRNSAGNGIPGEPVTVKSASGSAIAPASITTDSTGSYSLSVTPAAGAKNDTITASSAGAVAQLALTFSQSSLTFSQPAANANVIVGVVTNVALNFQSPGVALSGQTIQLFATRGTLSAASVTTDANGNATATISSPTAGASTVTAIAPDGTQQTLQFLFISVTPASIQLQASPGTVAVNLPGTTTPNSAQLLAKVRDAAGNPVTGVTVSFSALVDPSNGSISPATAVTDTQGIASVNFFPGANPTGNNAINLQAAVPGTTVVDTATLTAARIGLQIQMGTGNTLITSVPNDPGSTLLQMPWSVLVTDSAGTPQQNVTVTPNLVPTKYDKGTYVVSGTAWVQGVSATCASEDTNQNGRLDAGEDFNGNGRLDPGNVANVAASTGTIAVATDVNGRAGFLITYPRDHAQWVQVQFGITATLIDGTESVSYQTFWLPALAADLNNTAVLPPGYTSPYGVANTCSNPN